MRSDYQKELRRRIDRIHEVDMRDDDREAILEFHDKVKQVNRQEDRVSGVRHEKYLSDLQQIALGTGRLSETLQEPPAGEDAIDAIVVDVDEQTESGHTKDNRHSALRIFGELMTDGDDLPPRFEKVKLGHAEFSPPKQSEVLQWTDAVELIEATLNDRDKAIIAVLWASGCRPMSSFWELTYGDVVDKGDHFLISVPNDSKTGFRDIRIYVGAPYLRQWLEGDHPAHEEDAGLEASTPLWTKHHENRHLKYIDIRRSINRAADRTDLSKPNHPQHFRASRASVLASKHYMSQADLENHFGWARGSRSAAAYISRFADATGRHIALADGHPVPEDEADAPIAPVQCVSCERWTPRHRDTCLWCPEDVEATLDDQHPVDRRATVQEEGEDLLDLISDGDVEADDLRAAKRLEGVIRSREDFFQRVDDYIAMVDRMNDEE